jgi:uncharacterized repeat protein (TIGR03837 family)
VENGGLCVKNYTPIPRMQNETLPFAPRRVDIFCRVVDNLGDAGVCWRLARQLRDEYACNVQLIIDLLAPFSVIEPHVDQSLNTQRIDGIDLIVWSHFVDECRADLVIEAFACDPPEIYVASMAQRAKKPLWINLEYLSAEPWVDGVHGLPSPHRTLQLTKYFFVPGFSEQSGGLLCERSVRSAIVESPIKAAMADAGHAAVRIFALVYPQAPLHAVVAGFRAAQRSVDISLAAPNADDQAAWPTLHRVRQVEFDALLSRFDVLIVRGEDSFVRAQLAGKPMLWHVYPTADGAHIAKLDAWLDHYCAALDAETARVYRAAAHALVRPLDGEALVASFAAFATSLSALRLHAIRWQSALVQKTSLVERLMALYRDKSTD